MSEELESIIAAGDVNRMENLITTGDQTVLSAVLRGPLGIAANYLAIREHRYGLLSELLTIAKRPGGLMHALSIGDTRKIRRLASEGADLNIRDDEEDSEELARTPLMEWARKGDLKLVKLLLELGADPNRVDYQDRSALAYARLGGKHSVIKALEGVTNEELRRKTKKVFSDATLEKSHSKLLEAVDQGDLETVRDLLEINQLNPDGRTMPATIDCCRNGDTKMLALLLKHGASPNGANGWLPLRFAVTFKHVECIKMLLDAGADVNKVNAMGPALVDASTTGRVDIVKLLLDRGADPRIRNEQGRNALEQIAWLERRHPDDERLPGCRIAAIEIQKVLQEKFSGN